MITPVAVFGPLLVSRTVKVIVLPTLGRGLLTILPRARSADWGFVEVVAVLLPVFGSNWSLWLIDAVFASAPGLVTRARIVSVRGVPTGTVPTVQTPVALL